MGFAKGGDDDFECSGGKLDDQGADADVESRYYTAKSLKEDDLSEALQSFRKAIDTEKGMKEYTDRGFKALEQSTKISFQLLSRRDDALKAYIELLRRTCSAVAWNFGKDDQLDTGLCQWTKAAEERTEED